MKKGKITLLTIIYSLCTWLFLCVDMGEIYPNVYKQEGAGMVVGIITELQRVVAGLGDFSLLKEVTFVALLYVFYKLLKKKQSMEVSYYILSAIMAVLYFMGESYRDTDSLAYICADPVVFFFFIVRFCGLFLVISYSMAYLIDFLDRRAVAINKEFSWSYWKILAVIAMFWIPCLLCFYPGGYSVDSQIQLRQFFGYLPLGDAQPPFNTFLIGICVLLGNAIGHSTLGLFLFTLIQFLFLLFAMTYAVWFVAKRVKNRLFTWIILIWTGTLSVFVFYSASIGRDATYSACLVLMAVSFYRMIELISLNDVKGCIVPMINYALFSFIACLLRHNGIYVVAAMAVGMLVYFIVKKISLVRMIVLMAIGIAGIFLSLVVEKNVYPSLGVSHDSNSLVYITKLQHTARIMLEYPDEITEEDRAVIGKLMNLERLEERYNPKTSDGIKTIIDLEADPNDVSAYNEVWLKEIAAHPGVLFEASINVSYGFLAPVDENIANDFGCWYYESEWPELNFKVPERLTGFRYLYEMFLTIWDAVPIVRLMQNPGIYTWLLVFFFWYAFRGNRKENIVCFIPGLVTAAFFFVLPSYYGHPRYCFPIIYSMFFYVGIQIIALHREGTT